MRKKIRITYGLAAAIAVLTFLVYVPALRNEFVRWDDGTYIVNNPFIHSLNAAFLRKAFFGFYAANWHPLTWISHALDYAVWGLNPLGHHLTNNILHAVNTFLVVLLAVRLMEAAVHDSQLTPHDSRLTSHGSRFVLIAASVTGLLFGLHPLHVESVAWISERKDLLCAMFFLLSIRTYLSYRSYRTYRAYSLSLFFFILALLSKPMAVSLPFVLLILDWYPFKRIASFRTLGSALFEKIPFLALSLMSAILTLLAQKAGEAMKMMEVVPLPVRTLVAVKALVAYLWKTAAPLNLLPLYPYPRSVSFFSSEFMLPVIIVVGITAACAVTPGKRKLLPACWFYYLITLVPVLGIVQVGAQPMADRYTYLPGLGPFFAAGLLSAWFYEKAWTAKRKALPFRIGSIAVAAAILVSLSYATLRQISVWQNSVTLWSHVIEKEPLKVPRAYINGGIALVDRGRVDEAIEYLRIAVRLEPGDVDAHNNLGVAYKSKGMFDLSIEEYLKALRLKPGDAEFHNNLGVVYRYKGIYDKAIEQYLTALSLKPDYAEAHFNLGIIYFENGALEKARLEFETGLKIKPDDPKARQVLDSINSR